MPTLPESRVLHIDITGHDAPGVTHALTSILARSGARILDIGQAVIHDALALGILVELTDEMKSSSLLTELLLKAHELGVQIRFSAITGDEYPGVGGHAGEGPIPGQRPRPGAHGRAAGGRERHHPEGGPQHRPHRAAVGTHPARHGLRGPRLRRAGCVGRPRQRGRDAGSAAGADPPARRGHRLPARQRTGATGGSWPSTWTRRSSMPR